jgi:hypothetical protein
LQEWSVSALFSFIISRIAAFDLDPRLSITSLTAEIRLFAVGAREPINFAFGSGLCVSSSRSFIIDECMG